MQSVEKKLLILDLDETLVYATEEKLERQEDFTVGEYFVYKRPHLQEFIEFCVENFGIAVWTSSSHNYATKIVEEIFPNLTELKFFWSRLRCTIRYDEELQENYFEKMMSKVRNRKYDLAKVIVVDDSPEKLRNSYGNLVRIKPFFGDNEDNELQKLMVYLQRLRDAENIRKIEKRMWQNRI
ncbi:MAG: HAD family hydrolase [Pyrinomonadaceae bacterium]|nr:HAD family hydrolase [Pyrinomonadaceae bacterium]